MGRRSPFRHSGFLALAAFVAVAALTFDRWSGEAAVPPAASTFYIAIDGDSLRSADRDIRLLGVDAPELLQTCRDGAGREWACGRAAHARLKALVAHGEVRCQSGTRDRYGRSLARCSAGPVADLGEAMVREGLALDFMDGGYRSAERDARKAARGIWRGTFDLPQEHRPAQSAPGRALTAAQKGNEAACAAPLLLVSPAIRLAVIADGAAAPVLPASPPGLTVIDLPAGTRRDINPARLMRGADAAADDSADHGTRRAADREAGSGADHCTRRRACLGKRGRRSSGQSRYRRGTNQELTHRSILRLLMGHAYNDFNAMAFPRAVSTRSSPMTNHDN